MSECGWEGVSIKIVKKSQFEHAECEKPHVEKENVSVETAQKSSGLSNDIVIAVAATETSEQAKPENVTPKTSETNTKPPISNAKSRAEQKGTKRSSNKAEDTAAISHTKDTGNVSSCVIELKVVWFNFAAPPRAPITRKIDYTRLDWNLLSTVSPAINAWMNPSNRLAIRVVHMVRTMYRRSTAIIACLMAEAMDIQGIHQLTKVSD